MMLNRDNYEMYFLLYIDNELDAVQRGEVESFIEQHPDLAIELTDLQNTLLTEEEPAPFPDKTMLYRQADKETELLLYINSELNTAEKATLEKELQLSRALQQQLQQLQQAVLPHENIVFEHKESLYRHQRRVIPMSPFVKRTLTAAAVMAAVAITGWSLFNDRNADITQPGQAFNKPSDSNPSLASTPKSGSGINNPSASTSSLPAKTSKPDEIVAGQKNPEQEHIATAPSTAPIIIIGGVNRSARTTTRQKPASETTSVAPIIASTNGKPAAGASIVKTTIANVGNTVSRPSRVAVPANIKPGQEASLIITPATIDGQTSAAAGTAIAKPAPSRTGTSGNISDASGNTELPEQASTTTLAAMPHTTPAAGATVKTTVYKELDVTEGNESLYIGNLELNKNKLAGIFKRAGRLFGKQSR